MPGVPRRRGHEFEPQRLQPQENVGVEQRTGMNEEELHRDTQQPEENISSKNCEVTFGWDSAAGRQYADASTLVSGGMLGGSWCSYGRSLAFFQQEH